MNGRLSTYVQVKDSLRKCPRTLKEHRAEGPLREMRTRLGIELLSASRRGFSVAASTAVGRDPASG
jgi:hypothetical protein